MNNKKHIIGLEQFRDILQICPKVGNKKFVDPPLENEILIFLASLGHSGDIRKLTDWDDLHFFKIENKSTKKGSAMYYPRFTKLVVNYVMEKDPSIPRRNKVNWHYARDDPMFTTINVISRNEATQLYGAILPVALQQDIRNSESYKEYYAMASGTIPPKTKGSKKKANTDAIPKQKPPTAPKEKKSGKRKQKTTELENISRRRFDRGLTTQNSHKKKPSIKLIALVLSGSGAMKYCDESSLEDDEQAEDDGDAGKNDVNETTQDAEDDEDDEQADDDDDDEHDDDKKLTTHDKEDSDNDVDGANVAGTKSDKDATNEKDQGNEAVKDTNTDLDGRDKVMIDVEDTQCTKLRLILMVNNRVRLYLLEFFTNILNPNQITRG
ncbi:hypothetical protein Tco_1155776 [Tanacetum coccineum]